ncbi:dioxygenase [Parahaliea sp. F7430]|uniref:Dioxygenase n=1 Tax=Sediminihaliea albiluteola TaxID=2758564 RepID=A0A7W2YI93_9GAMM|nr:class III extradiol ring-cleavage dioxygenase [Sediminihaliea albiluteola]MBA6412266.1 dioxygenase [Sediminihaliea albiluteola]
MSERSLRSLYISHGGGPLPLMGDPAHMELVATLKQLAANMPRPEAIIVVSAHWEADVATVLEASAPPLYYDYSGFPPETYSISYPVAGHPELAAEVRQCLAAEGLAPAADSERGFDHGLFIPLKIMYPDASIPCIQLSLLRSMDPAAHIRMGKALARLERPNVLLLGSGSSFHNLQAYFGKPDPDIYQRNQAFENWLVETLGEQSMDETEREQRLVQWSTAPHARYCHPREEHLLPLHVCYGASASAASAVYRFNMLRMLGSCYYWE